MRSWKVLSVAAAVVVGFGAGEVKASHRETVDLVDGWYGRYLGRPADAVGLRTCVTDLRSGVDPIVVKASILASREYYVRHGATPEGFVIGLYRDVLGDRPCSHDLRLWCDRFRHCGCRETLAIRFLRENRVAVARPVIVEPVVTPRPVVVEPVVVHRPVVAHPAPVYRVPVYDPHSSFHLRTRNFGLHIRY
jgi:hypothetical protein